MPVQFLFLCIQTLILWLLVIVLHRQKNRFTLIPLYAYIAVLTLLTHNLSDLGFAVTMSGWFFLISSFSFFTALMLGILFIYLFEGPRATRLALFVILGVSFFYIGVVYLLGLQANTGSWVALSPTRFVYYFWSISAIIVDVFFITIVWELLGKIQKLPFFLKVFLVIFGTYCIDTLIFATGVFGGQPLYASVLRGDLSTRLILAIIATPIISFLLKSEGYKEEVRDKPKDAWEILNFRSDLETRIESMEESNKEQKRLEGELKKSHEKYALALEGTNAGIWDWDIINDHIMYSVKFMDLIGYKKEDLLDTIEVFKKQILHPEDVEKTFKLVDECFAEKKPFSIEYRLKTKEKGYKWFSSGGVTKFNAEGKPERMVGSIIDIDEKRKLIASYEEKVKELETLNHLMVGRELQMFEMKKKLADKMV